MPFIDRDTSGRIIGAFARPQRDGQEYVKDDHPDLVTFNAPSYQELRVREYPPMADYLDAIVKGDEAQRLKYISDCLAVKAKYPKE